MVKAKKRKPFSKRISKQRVNRWKREASKWVEEYSDVNDPMATVPLDEVGVERLNKYDELDHLDYTMYDRTRSTVFAHQHYNKVRENAKQKVRNNIQKFDDANRLTKIEPSFMGKRRVENPKNIPHAILDFWNGAKNAKPPILRKKERGAYKQKTKSSVKDALAGKTERSAPNYRNWDWQGGLGASEFELAKDSRKNRTHAAQRGCQTNIVFPAGPTSVENLPYEMQNTLNKYIERNVGENIWQDEVASRLSRPLDATVFCSSAVREELPGAGPRFVNDLELMYGHPITSEVGRLKNASRGSSVAYAPTSAAPTSRGTLLANHFDAGSRGSSAPGTEKNSLAHSEGSRGSSRGADVFPTIHSQYIGGVPTPPSSAGLDSNTSSQLQRVVRTPPILPRRADALSASQEAFRPLSSESFRQGITLTQIWSQMPAADMSKYKERPRTTPAALMQPMPHQTNRAVGPLSPLMGSSLKDFFAAPSISSPSKRRRSSFSRGSAGRLSESRQSMRRVQENFEFGDEIGMAMEPSRRLSASRGSSRGRTVSVFQDRPLSDSSAGTNNLGEDFETTGYIGLPRGVSRTKAVFAVRRFPYGDDAHHAANTIRRAWHGWHVWRHNNIRKAQALIRAYRAKTTFANFMYEECHPSIIIIQKYSRRFLAKLELNRMRILYLETCAVRIQTCWRAYLGREAARRWLRFVRRRAATNIQRVYRGRLGRKEFKRVHAIFMMHYNAALDCQRVWRAYFYGRMVVWRIRRNAAVEIQRVGRGMLGRLRAKNWLQIRSAAVIQKLVRGHLGKLRAARVYKRRVDAEKARMKGENAAVDKEVTRERARLVAFLKIPGGKRELKEYKKQIKRERRVAKIEHQKLSPFMRERADVEKIFKRFDCDLSGSIDAEEFRAMAKDLCIPLTDSELLRTMQIVDTDRNGTIEFSEFYMWYTNDMKNDSASMVADGGISSSKMARIRFQLKARKAWRYLTGTSLAVEATNRMVLEKCTDVDKSARLRFRKLRRAPFQCEKCMKAFVFDYELTRHSERHPDCDTSTFYDVLKREALQKERDANQLALQQKVNKEYSATLKERVKLERVQTRKERRQRKHKEWLAAADR